MSEPRLCPFRKKLKADLSHVDIDLKVDAIKIWDEVFGECLKDKCQMWRIPIQKSHGGTIESGPGYCGLAGRP